MPAFLYDTFTEGTDTDIDSHTPEIGGTWVIGNGDPYVVSSLGAVRGSLSSENDFYNSVVPPSNSYEILAHILTRTATVGTINIYLGHDSGYAVADGYRVYVEQSSKRIYLYQYNSGWVQISSRYNGGWSNDTTLKIKVSMEDDYDAGGNRRITLYTSEDGGAMTQRLQYDETDGVQTSQTLPGKVGVYITTRDSSSAYLHLDYISADVVGGAHQNLPSGQIVTVYQNDLV